MGSFLKPVVLMLFLILLFPGCEGPEENPPAGEFVICGEKNPDWFMDLIEEAESDSYYIGSVIYQCEYQGSYLFHFMIPLSSWAYCRVYDCDGNLVEWTSDEEFTDFLNKMKDGTIIWQREY